MSCTSSLIITSFQRPHLLKWGLYSIAQENIPFDFEVIVINDGIEDGTREICEEYTEKLNLKYIFSGQRNVNGQIKWRVPGFAINIGAKKAAGKIFIISCAEMFHLNDTIAKLTAPLLDNPNLMVIPEGRDDNGTFLNRLNMDKGYFNINTFYNYQPLSVFLPFLMGVSQEQFFAIGGYDEDFIEIAYDDNDFVERLRDNGCEYYQTDAKTIHLFHPRLAYDLEFNYNKNLYLSRKGQIVRNENRDWGKVE